jgi:PAS domain S-box-containing protein
LTVRPSLPERRHSLRSRLPLLLLAAIAIVLGPFLWITYREVERTLLLAAGERAQQSADQISALFGPQISERSRETLRAAADASIRTLLRDPAAADKAAAERTLRALRNAASVQLWTANRELLLSLSTAGGAAVTFEPVPPQQLTTEIITAGNRTFTQNIVEITAHGAGTPAAAPLLGYLVVRRAMTLSPPDLFERLVGTGAVLLGAKQGGMWTAFPGLVQAPTGDLRQPRGTLEYRSADGSRRLGALSEITGSPWTVLVGYSRDAIVAPARQFLRRASIAALLLVAVALFISRFVSARITSPLVDLSRAAAAMAEGDYSRRVVASRRDEIGQLGRAFNMMADHVAAAERDLGSQVKERERAAEALLESERAYRSTFDEAPVGIAHTSLDGRLLRVNARLSALLDYVPSDLLAIDRTHLIHPDELLEDSVGRQQVLAGQVEQFAREGRLRTRSGAFISVAVTVSLHRDSAGQPAYFISIITDISERRRLESQLRQAQKMEAVGRLAGGVAHDFNNLLTAILGFAAMLLEDLPPDDPNRSAIVEIQRAGQSAAALTKQLLAFSRLQILNPEVLDLNAVVRRIDALLQRVIGEDIDLVLRLAPRLDHISADAGQIEQVIMNLAINARDAMPTGGMLTIETATVELDRAHVVRHPGSRDGRHVMLAITDNGVGMTREVQAQIFEPFFTTKKRGDGTGLGLATVYGIVKQSGGWIWVYSEVGRGTTFKVYFPVTNQPARVEPSADPQQPLGGHETILIAEDQAEVRMVASAVLQRSGYTVLEAASGEEALAIVQGHAGPIHLLLTDVVMPAMSGRELAEGVKTLRPDIRVLYASGYADDAIVRHGVLDADVAFIQKPFTPHTLNAKVRDVLDAVS